MVTCDLKPPEHVPRTSARAHTCAVVFGWAPAPCVPWSREHEKRPAGREAKKTHVYTVIYVVVVLIFLVVVLVVLSYPVR